MFALNINPNSINKFILSNFLISLISISAICQTVNTNRYVGLSIVASLPIGDFSSTDTSIDNAGFANAGRCIDVSLGYSVNKFFGLCALFRFQSNDFNAQSLSKILEKKRPQFSWTVTAEPWKATEFMGGVNGTFPLDLNSITAIEIKGLIGIARITSPEIVVTGKAIGMFAGVTEESKIVSSIIYLVGIGYRYNIGMHVSMFINLDYSYSKPEFTDVKLIAPWGTYSTTSFNQKIENCNIGVGVAFKM